MLFITILIVVAVVLLATRLRTAGDSPMAPHGSVSERWLAEYRASHSV